MNLLTAKEAIEYLHVSLFTLGRIERERLLVPFRTPGGHRRYSLEMLNEYLERTRSRPGDGEKRILVVDDGEEVVDRLAGTFPSCRFSRAEDELSVGMKLAEFKPDLVLVNTGIPGLDGLDLCGRLDGREKQLKVVPFRPPRQTGEGADAEDFDLSSLGVLEHKIARFLEERSSGHLEKL